MHIFIFLGKCLVMPSMTSMTASFATEFVTLVNALIIVRYNSKYECLLTDRGAISFYDRNVLLNLLNTFPDVGRSNFSCGACPTSFSVIIDRFLQNAILFMFFAGRNEPSVFLSSGCLDTSSMINKTPESFPQ